MAQIELSRVIEGVIGPVLKFAGVPGAGTDEVQTLTIGGTPTAGTFKLAFEGFVTSAITWSATNATLLANIQAALDALASLGTNGLIATAGTLTAGIGTILLTAGGNRTKESLPGLVTIDTNALTGTAPTLANAETTPGVNAAFRGVGKGAVVSDVTNAKAYTNTGTAIAPTWTIVGTQT